MTSSGHPRPTKGREWIDEFFDATYVRHLRAQGSAAVTRKEVAFAVKALELRRGARVLDVPCGFGGHARLLARRGMRVVGVDLSPAMLTEARRRPAVPRLRFERGDMRRLRYESKFDAVVNLYPASQATVRHCAAAASLYFTPHARPLNTRRSPTMAVRAAPAAASLHHWVLGSVSGHRDERAQGGSRWP